MTPSRNWCVPAGTCSESSAGLDDSGPVNESVRILGGTNHVGLASVAICSVSSFVLAKGEDAVDSRGWEREPSISADVSPLTSNQPTRSLKAIDKSLSNILTLDYIKIH